MIAAIYTNQSTHIWKHAAPPATETATPGYSYVWKRPLESYRHRTVLRVVVTIRAVVQYHRAATTHTSTLLLKDVRQEVQEEVHAFISGIESWSREQAAQAEEARLKMLSEHARIVRQQEEDEELMVAASVLFEERKPVMSWMVRMRKS